MYESNIITLQIPNFFTEGRNRVYVLRTEPITLIDSGIATDKAYGELVAQLASHGLRTADIKRVVLTHKHIDHVGNAWRIQQDSGAEVFIHESELEAVVEVDPAGEKFAELVKLKLEQWDVPDDAQPENTSFGKWNIQSVEATPLQDGQELAMEFGPLQVLHTPGHTAGHICLLHGEILFSGDHVLPDISPNVGGGDMRRGGLLKGFMTSLERTIELSPQIKRVLPGHGDPFENLSGRCEELLFHHRERLEKTQAILNNGKDLSAYEVAVQLFGELKDFHVVLGCAEAQAHLEYLVDEGAASLNSDKYCLS